MACKHTTCIWDGRHTTIFTNLRDTNNKNLVVPDHWHCEKFLIGTGLAKCKCVCDASFQCVIRHHHHTGYMKTFKHCFATPNPTAYPTTAPTAIPTTAPTEYPTTSPTNKPTGNPTATPTGSAPTFAPTAAPTAKTEFASVSEEKLVEVKEAKEHTVKETKRAVAVIEAELKPRVVSEVTITGLSVKEFQAVDKTTGLSKEDEFRLQIAKDLGISSSDVIISKVRSS
jgi:hypothetical protein